ncbi:MAG: diguanylate cyclase [Henriciella sp.]|uniref:diguanylate cyclase n=1 Tax=Henriciella sp. TaxID=1968823 RepID=UPI0032EEEF95
MSVAEKKAGDAGVAAPTKRQHKDVYDLAGQAFRMIDRYETPPYPSTYALWFAYVSRSNTDLVSTVDEMLEKGGDISAYEIDEVCKSHLNEGDVQAAQQTIGRQFESQLASVLTMIQKSVSDSESFNETLNQIEEGLPQTASTDSIDAIISKLMVENRRMAEQSMELNSGLRESQKQIEKLNRELEEVRSQSMRDPLTSVANRRAFDARLTAEIEACTAPDSELCLVLADIDHFKKVNDTYGHRVGDEVLKVFAAIISENIKGQDMVARYGGEEFAVILPRTDIESAYGLIDKIRLQFSKTNLIFKQSRQGLGKITASFGIASHKPGIDAKGFIEQADRKLYLAKDLGRNQVQAEGIVDAAA